jgi:hypothetical protein
MQAVKIQTFDRGTEPTRGAPIFVERRIWAAHCSYVLACIVFGNFAPISPKVR